MGSKHKIIISRAQIVYSMPGARNVNYMDVNRVGSKHKLIHFRAYKFSISCQAHGM